MSNIVISRVVIPNKGWGKFVQLYVDGKAYFRAHQKVYHYQLFDGVLNEFGIIAERFKDHDDDLLIPKLEGENYRAVGMGSFICRDDALIFGGSSASYGINLDEEHIKEILPYFPRDIRIMKAKKGYILEIQNSVEMGMGEGR